MSDKINCLCGYIHWIATYQFVSAWAEGTHEAA